MGNYIWPEITEETTIEELQVIHKRIWNYAIEHGVKPCTPYDCDCVGCHIRRRYFGSCRDCVIDWGEGRTCHDGLYSHWLGETRMDVRRKLAVKIRDLPFRDAINKEHRRLYFNG